MSDMTIDYHAGHILDEQAFNGGMETIWNVTHSTSTVVGADIILISAGCARNWF